jgi:arylsulfatase A-like enzyme
MNPGPNVLLITADQWRGDSLSALDHPTVKTPSLDSLAADGVLFRNHFAQCAPCGPSRASLYSGLYMMNHRSVRNGVPLDARFTNIALEARKGGYDPCLLGYTDTSADPREYHPDDPILSTYAGVLPGFRVVASGTENKPNAAWRRYLAAKGYVLPSGWGEIRGPVPDYPGAEERGPTFAPPFYTAEDSDTAFMVNHAISFIESRDDLPWFLHLSIERPHPPFIAPEPYNAMYHPDDVPGFRRASSPEEESLQHPYVAYMIRNHLGRDDHNPKDHPTTGQAMRQLRASYYGLMGEVDHHMGRLFARLKELGQYDDCLIIFTSDHGEQLWDHWLLGKEHYFDQSFHIPLIVRASGENMDKARGRVVEAFTENIDVMPTILDGLCLNIPLQCDGTSLSEFLTGGEPGAWRREAHWELDFRDIKKGLPEKEMGIRLDECSLSVVRDLEFKYVHFAALPPVLYDLKKDPDELQNVVNDPAYREPALTYARKLLSWRMAQAERTLTGIRLSEGGPFECPPDLRFARPCSSSRSPTRISRRPAD